ncbi:hypothetical protein MHYP_G00269550 [Metynnis hypsauchen]
MLILILHSSSCLPELKVESLKRSPVSYSVHHPGVNSVAVWMLRDTQLNDITWLQMQGEGWAGNFDQHSVLSHILWRSKDI